MKSSVLNYLLLAVVAFSACNKHTESNLMAYQYNECSSALEPIKTGLSLKAGVNVSDVMRVDNKCSIIALDLDSKKIDANGLNFLFDNTTSFPKLRTLSISSFQDLTDLPETIGDLTTLTTLTLTNNSKLTSLPVTIGNLTNLTTLMLDQNSFTTLPTEISNLTNLTTLNLSSNQLATLPTINKLVNLSEVFLDKNKFSIFPEQILGLSNLFRLILQYNQLTTLPAELGNLNTVRYLDLDYNPNLTSLQQSICRKIKFLNQGNLHPESYTSFIAPNDALTSCGLSKK